jgi:periplasmic protein TonB
MFDLITGHVERPFHERAPRSKLVAAATHTVVLVLVVGISLLSVTNTLPEVPTVMAFAASAPAPPPPPPPPPAQPSATQPVAEPTPKPGALAAPIEAPSSVKPESPTAVADALAGVVGGVEGGVPGGVVGGIVGGLVSPAPPPPPPPPPPPTSRTPVRIGGQITAPALVHRVEPTYPDIAVAAQVTGMVILEAVVNTEGCVESVKVLRPVSRILDQAAVEALKQWQYSPLVLNGVPTSFVLTVTFNFSVVH